MKPKDAKLEASHPLGHKCIAITKVYTAEK